MAVFFPREAITSDNFVPVVNIVTWILLVSMVLAVCTKVAMKVIGRHTFNIDDSVLVAAMVILSGFLALSKLRKRFCVSGRQRCAIDYFLCTDLQWRRTSFGVPHHLAGGDIREGPTLGLGVQRRILTKTQAGYSADLLYIIALAISKVSVLVLLWQITPVAVHRRMTLGVGSFIAAWTLASFFASVFQCSTPDTWMILSQHCFDRTSFWTTYGIINILIEAILILMPTYTIGTLHMSSQRKAAAISCFAIRGLVMGAIIAQLILLIQQRDTNDATLDTWSYYLSAQFVQSLSVITACVPYIKNVLLGVESGMFQTGHFGLATMHKSPRRTQEHGSSAARSRKEAGTGTSGLRSHQSPDPISHDLRANGTRTPQTNPFSADNTATAESVTPVEDWDGDSLSSRVNIIKETREWHVDYEA